MVMKAVFVVEKNEDSFISSYTQDQYRQADVSIGAIDESNDTACGLLTAQILPSGKIRITYIYVHEKYRRQGAGRCMVDLLDRVAANARTGMLEYRSVEDSEADRMIKAFLEGVGFSYSGKSILFSVPVSEFRDSDDKPAGSIETVASLSQRSWYRYSEMMDMAYPWRGTIDGDLSLVLLDGNYNPVGVLFGSRVDDGANLITFKVRSDNPGYAAKALYGYAIKQAKKLLSEDDMIYVEVGDMKKAKMLFDLTEAQPAPQGAIEYLTRKCSR